MPYLNMDYYLYDLLEANARTWKEDNYLVMDCLDEMMKMIEEKSHETVD